MIGFAGRRDWQDMSDYLVHFTKPPSPYDKMMSILANGRLLPGDQPFGCAKNIPSLAQTQHCVCFSEAPLGHLRRLSSRYSLFGVAFSKDFLIPKGATPVWYLQHGTLAQSAVAELVAAAAAKGPNPNDELWKLTPFIDFPGRAPSAPYNYKFEWEREWRLPGPVEFSPSDVAFLLLDEADHVAARDFFEGAEQDGIGPNFRCPYFDPRWDVDRIQRAFSSHIPRVEPPIIS